MDTVDNVTKDCLSNCEDQVNDLFVTTSNYPNKKTFKDREEFCILGKKLLTQTCKFPKRLPLTADFPDLCETLEALPDFLAQCKNNRSGLTLREPKSVCVKNYNNYPSLEQIISYTQAEHRLSSLKKVHLQKINCWHIFFFKIEHFSK